MECSYKFRLYPNKEQEQQILRTFGCCRFVYNHYLAERKRRYEESKETLSYYGCAKDLTLLKKQEETVWLKEVDATALQSSIRDLDTAYDNFFRGIKSGAGVGYPRFKSKRDHRQSYRTVNTGSSFKVLDNKIQLPKLGFVKCKISKAVKGRILSATISRNPSGKYFVSINCTDVEMELLPLTGAAIGLTWVLSHSQLHPMQWNMPTPNTLRKVLSDLLAFRGGCPEKQRAVVTMKRQELELQDFTKEYQISERTSYISCLHLSSERTTSSVWKTWLPKTL